MTGLPPAPPLPGPPQWPQLAPPRPRWLGFASLVVALVAIGLAIGAFFRPAPSNKPPAAPAYSDQQVADAKARVCAAFDKVSHALDIADAQNGGTEYTAQLAVATSIRQALEVGSRYLLTTLAQQPATPRGLATEVRKLANYYQEAVVGYIAHVSDFELKPSLRAGDKVALGIKGQCE